MSVIGTAVVLHYPVGAGDQSGPSPDGAGRGGNAPAGQAWVGAASASSRVSDRSGIDTHAGRLRVS